jgi:hypothetical protein
MQQRNLVKKQVVNHRRTLAQQDYPHHHRVLTNLRLTQSRRDDENSRSFIVNTCINVLTTLQWL